VVGEDLERPPFHRPELEGQRPSGFAGFVWRAGRGHRGGPQQDADDAVVARDVTDDAGVAVDEHAGLRGAVPGVSGGVARR
jgi:hypothetical protein